ncbi:hypothetical protein POP15_084 [Pectobacterium phage POP15]|nr:hypothetical protein POP15_084 [Pectobacterium phage POP15]
MITFLVTLMAHCFGRRPVDEVIWIIAVMIGILEILFGALLIAGALK